MPDEGFGVLDRVTAILDVLSDDDRGMGVTELAARAGMPKSTVSRLVSGLTRQGYLERDGAIVRLGLRLFELGELAQTPKRLRAAALPVMSELRRATGCTVMLDILDGAPAGDVGDDADADLVCIAVLRATPDPAGGAARVGSRRSVIGTTAGEAIRTARPVRGDVTGTLRIAVALATATTLDAALTLVAAPPADPAALERALADAARALERALAS